MAGLRVALATTHLPLKDVPAAITQTELTPPCASCMPTCVKKFGIARPRILVAGLNPHAGEGGHLGREEIEVIAPVLERLRAEGMDLVGPLPADTLFTRNVLAGSDAQLAMYHDQGLAVLKYAAFDEGINVTLGLPIIRTSVDHGTALDLAGTGRADHAQPVRGGESRRRHRRPLDERARMPRKRFGQNFLVSPGVIRNIVDGHRAAPR